LANWSIVTCDVLTGWLHSRWERDVQPTRC